MKLFRRHYIISIFVVVIFIAIGLLANHLIMMTSMGEGPRRITPATFYARMIDGLNPQDRTDPIPGTVHNLGPRHRRGRHRESIQPGSTVGDASDTSQRADQWIRAAQSMRGACSEHSGEFRQRAGGGNQ